MQVPAPPAVEAARSSRGDLRSFLIAQLRPVLEHRSVRLSVVATLTIAASAFNLVPQPVGVDASWMYVVPVAISAIAGGLKEGLFVALVASTLSSFFVGAQVGTLDALYVLGGIPVRFALYGITAAFLGAFADVHYSVQSNLRELASTDPLTKVANITSFYTQLDVLQTGVSGFAMLLCDVDDLKALNDAHGHQAGSEAIQAVADALRAVVRQSDCVARFGGDEFVVILKDADRPGAESVVDRVREILADMVLPHAPERRVRVSIGIAVYGEDGITSDDLLTAADQAMYTNKRFHKGLSASGLLVH